MFYKNSLKYRRHALILGCSFTSGSYTWDPEHIVYKEALQPDGTYKTIDQGIGRERMDANGTWVRWLDPADYYTIYALPGSGIIQHAAIVKNLDIEGKLDDIDYVIVQKTYEPRLVLTKLQRIASRWHDNFKLEPTPDVENIIMWRNDAKRINLMNGVTNGANLGGHFKNDQYNQWLKDLYHSTTTRTAMQSAYVYIDETCKTKNIPLFEVSFTPQHDEGRTSLDNSIKLDLPKFFGSEWAFKHMMYKKKYHVFGPIDASVSRDGEDIFTGHYTFEGNKKIGKMIRKQLDKHL